MVGSGIPIPELTEVIFDDFQNRKPASLIIQFPSEKITDENQDNFSFFSDNNFLNSGICPRGKSLFFLR